MSTMSGMMIFDGLTQSCFELLAVRGSPHHWDPKTSWPGPTPPARALPPWAGGGSGGGGGGGGGAGGGGGVALLLLHLLLAAPKGNFRTRLRAPRKPDGRDRVEKLNLGTLGTSQLFQPPLP